MLRGSKPDNQLNKKLGARAEELFASGYNCCESVIKASVEIFELPLPEDIHLMGKFFQRGLGGAGCVCGALAGGMMMLGYITGKEKKGLSQAEEFRTGFIEKFGSSCCRVIRKKRPVIERFRSKECKMITGFTAEKLQEVLNLDYKQP